MSLTNLVLLATSLATNQQSAVTGRTNGLAQVSHLEQVQRVEVTAWRSGRRILSRQTNIVNLPPRRWSEVVPDLSAQAQAPPPVQPAPPVAQVPPQSTPPVPAAAVQPSVSTGGSVPRTNSPAFQRQRRAEIEARRAAAQAARTNATPLATPAPPALKP